MLKKVFNKQYKKSIFSCFSIAKEKSYYEYRRYPLIDEFTGILADPKLNFDQVVERIDTLLGKDKKLINAFDECNYTPLMCAICNSVNYLNTTERIEFLLDRGANPNVISHGSFGYTPLILAIKDLPISHSIVKILLKYGCTVDDRTVWQSVMFGSFDTVKLLEHHNTKLISDMKDEYNRTVLDYAEIFTRDEYFKYKLYRHYEQQKLKSLIKKD